MLKSVKYDPYFVKYGIGKGFLIYFLKTYGVIHVGITNKSILYFQKK